MRIERLHIINYGKFENKLIDFEGGFNVIYGENEAGKSTIISFIKAMLYGFGDSKGDIRKSDRKRFMPWNGKAAMGEMYVEHMGRRYCIARTSGRSKAYDTLKVLDASTGLEADFDIAEALGVSEESFEKTALIRQLGMSSIAASSDDEIMRRLSNLAHSGSEEVSYKNALEILEKFKRKFVVKNNRSAGKIAQLENEIYELETEKSRLERLSAELFDKRMRIDELKETADRKKKELDKVNEEIKNTQKFILYNEYNRINEERQNQLQLCRKLRQEFEALENDKKEIDEDVSFADTSMLQALGVRAEMAKASVRRYKASAWALCALALISSAALFFVNPLGLCALLLLIPAAVLFFALKRSFAHYSQLQAEIRRLEEDERKNNEILEKYGCKTKDEFYRKLHEHKEREIRIINAKNEYLLRTRELEEINAKLDEAMQKILDKYGIIEEVETTDIDIEGLNEKAKKLSDEIMSIEREISEISGNIRNAFAGKHEICDVEAEIEEKKESLNAAKKYLRAVDLAISALENAFEKQRQEFMPRLNERAGEILSEIIEDKDYKMLVSHEYDVTLSTPELKSIGYFSNGTVDQVYFALRLALIDLVFDDAPPLILDDPFVQFDRVRTQSAVRLLERYAKDGQILLFTAGDTSYFKKSGINLINI